LLHWSVSNAVQVSIDGTPVANQGSKQVCPAAAAVYALSAVGSDGQSAGAMVQLQVRAESQATPTPGVGSIPYTLQVGGQHRYEEPWGGDYGNPCEAWRTGNFDDDHPFYRGFNLELLLDNNTSSKIADDWGKNIRFYTAAGGEVTACYYGYDGAGPPPGATASVTFFTVVPKGDYVQVAQLDLGGYTIRLCLDGKGNSWDCS